MQRIIRQLFIIASIVISATASRAQAGCQSQSRMSEILEVVKSKGLQSDTLNLVLLPELRDSFISLKQTNPDFALLRSMCFYALRKEIYTFNGGEMPIATIDLQETRPEWYLASSPGKIYILRGFPDATQEFNRMMRELHASVDSPDDAEAAFDLYIRSVYGESFRSQIVSDELKLIALAAEDFRLRYSGAKRDEAFRQWLNTKRRQHVRLHPPKARKDGDEYSVSYFGYVAGVARQRMVVIDHHGAVREEPANRTLP